VITYPRSPEALRSLNSKWHLMLKREVTCLVINSLCWDPPDIGTKPIRPAQSQDMHIPGVIHPANKTQSITLPGTDIDKRLVVIICCFLAWRFLTSGRFDYMTINYIRNYTYTKIHYLTLRIHYTERNNHSMNIAGSQLYGRHWRPKLVKSDYIFCTTSPAGDLTISVLRSSGYFFFHSTILFRDSVTRDTSRMIIIYWEVPYSQFRFKFARCSANIYEWHCLMYRLCII